MSQSKLNQHTLPTIGRLLDSIQQSMPRYRQVEIWLRTFVTVDALTETTVQLGHVEGVPLEHLRRDSGEAVRNLEFL